MILDFAKSNLYCLSSCSCVTNVYFPRVIFENTIVTAPLNKALWSIWNTGDERIDDVFLTDFNTTGGGAVGASRASFSTLLTASQAASYSIASAVGSDFATWVDSTYLV
jgi:pectinesterase